MRIVLMIFRKFFLVPGHFYRLWKAGKNYNGDYGPGYKAAKAIASQGISAGNITIEAHGTENVPKEPGFIYYPNHQGMFDVLAFMDSSPQPFAFVIKKEAKDVILLKQTIAATGSLPMDRDDIRQSMQVINQVAQEVKEGRNYLIFAEGHRSREGNKLLDFKGGSFKAAQKAKCPIVPCALIDSFVPFDEKSTRHVTVKVIYLKPMYYEEYQHMKSNEIADEVKRRIEEAIKKYEHKK
ncbi:MAG: 1-acyl-sn-glycerol-3-phosphate acyltransferase [Lachnospiraceae bacterium]|nr:1-acyl-sn-glycerol-3-phosphate acyltransferase [Lachnospiraceae bacterium]